MTNTELRLKLLAQHEELRDLVTMVRRAADAARAGRVEAAELRVLLQNLAREVMSHNQFEERELHKVLPDIDAWGKLRDGRVAEHHSAEHEAIVAGLDATRHQPELADLAAQALRATDALMAHLEREERDLLATEVLRDDLITSGVGG